jgi:putative FmdB family regulatory protein
MPLYTYYCQRCLRQETRVAGLDDQVAHCSYCGRAMRRRGSLNSFFAAYR